eukprot:m.28776 g.28776  ORF g.28776 m.28776 type:complete len:347 (+) comp11880_c0_seq1:395-1435(+)
MMATSSEQPSASQDATPRSRKRIMSMARQVTQVNGLHLSDGQQPFEQNSLDERREFEKLRDLAHDLPEYHACGDFWALACLRARKYDLARTLELMKSFDAWRTRLQLLERNYHTDAELQALIKLGVVEPTGQRDVVGHYVLVLRMAKADPKRFTPDDAIRNIYAALEYLYRRYPEAQSAGVAVLVDQRGASLKNMDTAVPRILFKALANHVPCRFGGLYTVDPPLFMRMLLPVAKLLLKRKLRDRLHVLRNVEDLLKYFQASNLLEDFGGTMASEHDVYLECVSSLQAREPYASADKDDSADNCSLASENDSMVSCAASEPDPIASMPEDDDNAGEPTAAATVSLV